MDPCVQHGEHDIMFTTLKVKCQARSSLRLTPGAAALTSCCVSPTGLLLPDPAREDHVEAAYTYPLLPQSPASQVTFAADQSPRWAAPEKGTAATHHPESPRGQTSWRKHARLCHKKWHLLPVPPPVTTQTPSISVVSLSDKKSCLPHFWRSINVFYTVLPTFLPPKPACPIWGCHCSLTLQTEVFSKNKDDSISTTLTWFNPVTTVRSSSTCVTDSCCCVFPEVETSCGEPTDHVCGMKLGKDGHMVLLLECICRGRCCYCCSCCELWTTAFVETLLPVFEFDERSISIRP